MAVFRVDESEGSIAKFEDQFSASTPEASGLLEAAGCGRQLHDAPAKLQTRELQLLIKSCSNLKVILRKRERYEDQNSNFGPKMVVLVKAVLLL